MVMFVAVMEFTFFCARAIASHPRSMCPAELQSTSPDLWRDFTKVALASETLRPYWNILIDSGSQQNQTSGEVLSQ